MKLNQKIISMMLLILAFVASSFGQEGVKSYLTSHLTQFTDQNDSEKVLTLSLSNYYNQQYSGKILIGSNNDPLDLIFDTGFPWIWISPDNTNTKPTNTACSQSTCNWFEGLQNDEFTFISRSETVKGFLATETISFNNQNETKMDQMLLLSKPSEFIPTLYADGYCGLSIKNGQGTATLLDTLHKTNKISRKIFGLYLSDNPEAFNETTSEISFGGINPNYEKAEFINVHVKDSQYWQLDFDGLNLSAGSISPVELELSARTAVIASGINNIIMSKQDFTSFYNVLRTTFNLECSLGLTKELTCACSDGNISQFPNISFKFAEDKTLTIQPSLYLEIKENSCVVLIEGSLTNPKAYLTQDSENDSTVENKKSLGLDDGNFIILGGVFLRNFYTVFDAENKLVSFAKVIKPPRNIITALEVIYLIFGSFILVMFIVFVGCFIQICLTKKTPAEKTNLEKNLIERKTTLSQFVQGLESN